MNCLDFFFLFLVKSEILKRIYHDSDVRYSLSALTASWFRLKLSKISPKVSSWCNNISRTLDNLFSMSLTCLLFLSSSPIIFPVDWRKECKDKVHRFWESHTILRNLQQLFVLCTASQIIGGDSVKFCGLLRIYELEFLTDYISCRREKRMQSYSLYKAEPSIFKSRGAKIHIF